MSRVDWDHAFLHIMSRWSCLFSPLYRINKYWIIHPRFSLIFRQEVLFLRSDPRYEICDRWPLRSDPCHASNKRKKWKKKCVLCWHPKTKNGLKYNNELWITGNYVWCVIIGVALRKGTVKLYCFLWTMKMMMLIFFLHNIC